MPGRRKHKAPVRLSITRAARTVSKKCDEERSFRKKCARQITHLDTVLSQARYRRGIVIEWDGSRGLGSFGGVWGVGHMLTLAYRLHALAFRLRRFCYLRLYDAAYEDYFTFANTDRWSWKATKEELSSYERPPPGEGAARRIIALNCTLEQRWTNFCR